MNDALIFITLGAQLFTGIIVVFLFLSVQSMREQKKQLESVEIENAKKRAQSIIEQALKESETIVKGVQKQTDTILEGEKGQGQQVIDAYQKELSAVAKKLVDRFAESEKTAEADFSAYIAKLETIIEASAKKNEEAFNERSAAFFDTTTTAVGAALADVNGKIQGEVKKELEKMKGVVEEYQRTRMAVINENLVDIIEKTAAVALNKSLSMEEHTELIYAALEEAKTQNFFGGK